MPYYVFIINYAQFKNVIYSWNVVKLIREITKWCAEKWTADKRFKDSHLSLLQRDELLKNHINPSIGKMMLSAIEGAVINDFRNKMFKQGYSGNTIKKGLSAIKTIFKYLLKNVSFEQIN